MARRRNDIEVEDVTSTSQYDGLQVLKDAHSLPGHYIRTRESLTLVKPYYDSFIVEYDGNNPVNVEYYVGTKSHLTTIGVVGDVSQSLAGTYFIVSGGRKETRYAVYYTVDGNGTAPSLPGVINVEVPISEDDPASIVAYGTELVLNNLGDVFTIRRANAVLEVETQKLGVTNNTIDVGTGFTITNNIGTNELVETVNLTYSSSGFPIWQSQELRDYKYNVYTGRFEVNPDVSVDLTDLGITAENFEINNIDVPVANTPVTINIPNNAKRFEIQATLSNSVVKIIDNTTNDSFTLRYGTSKIFENLNSNNISFNVETSKDSNTIELIVWT